VGYYQVPSFVPVLTRVHMYCPRYTEMGCNRTRARSRSRRLASHTAGVCKFKRKVSERLDKKRNAFWNKDDVDWSKSRQTFFKMEIQDAADFIFILSFIIKVEI